MRRTRADVVVHHRLRRVGGRTERWLIRVAGRRSGISATRRPDGGRETMAYRSDARGRIRGWLGFRVEGWDHEAGITVLLAELNQQH
ncbi:hypothetical protein GCM10012275_42850 [Longimycelium tulufanense]|uniref:Uncharacterized protein n=1 Tax=Longimycelium tulufanense TaxID=907463 RepID=A0A8J3CHE2_9PSEU|nr:hypothetical protein [Longimycelium tulufanense]GGM67699.1 hypothetical protein GCM10012275_42850 [Longimycelium tulufanense]